MRHDALRACNGRLAQIYALPDWSEGSSACHVNTNYSSGTGMYFEGDPGASSRLYCPSETGMLKDMGYRHAENNSAGASLLGPEATDPHFDDASAAPGGRYYYWVQAANAAGTSAFSAAASGYRAIHPPTDVTATKGTVGGKIRIAWTGAAGAAAYEVWRGTSPAVTAAVQIAMAAATSYSDTNVVMGITNTYWIRAQNATCTSQFSRPDRRFRKRTRASRGFEGDGVADPWTAVGTPLLSDVGGDGLADPALNDGGSWTFWLSGDEYHPAGPYPFTAP